MAVFNLYAETVLSSRLFKFTAWQPNAPATASWNFNIWYQYMSIQGYKSHMKKTNISAQRTFTIRKVTQCHRRKRGTIRGSLATQAPQARITHTQYCIFANKVHLKRASTDYCSTPHVIGDFRDEPFQNASWVWNRQGD